MADADRSRDAVAAEQGSLGAGGAPARRARRRRGRASPAQHALAARAASALAAVREAAVPGATVSDIHARAESRLEDAELRASANAYGFGHGIGLDPEEAPFIVSGSDQRLAEGAVL